MGTSSDPFRIQPWAVLGVGRDATPSEIRSAFREKSKKHHPDLGGDEWAFRLVQHAYDSLKADPPQSAAPTMARKADPSSSTSRPEAEPSEEMEADAETSGCWLTQVWPNAVRWFHPLREGRSRAKSADKAQKRQASDSTDTDDDDEQASPEPGPEYWTASTEVLLALKTVEVDLIWLRLVAGLGEVTRGDMGRVFPRDRDAESTLSVSLVVAWPPVAVVDEVAGHPETVQALRSVIDAFESLKHGAGPTESHSGIEDGRFVGWMSYPDVLRAEEAFRRFREQLAPSGLSIRLRTGQEKLPSHWRRGSDPKNRRASGMHEARFG